MTDKDPFRILVLEDEAIIMLDIEYALDDAGMQAFTAASVAQALDLIAEKRPHAAVLDVNLGQGETCDEVATTLNALGVPFMLYSGDISRNDELFTKFGARTLTKPTSGNKIAKAIRALVTPDGC